VAETTPRTRWHPHTDKSLWEDFELMFRMAYTDQDAKLTAFQKLSELRMQGSDIDSYIADFDRLIDEAATANMTWES